MSDPASMEAPPVESSLDTARGSSEVWWLGYLMSFVFVALASWFVLGPHLLSIPVSADDPQLMADGMLSTEPRREILSDPPIRHIAGFDRTCIDCHRTFPSREGRQVAFRQHKHIVLNHGINDRCKDCHYDVDRNRLILRDGTVIGYGQVVELCAKCHGPTYRDWQRGAHGRTDGYWDSESGEQVRLSCTQCHDPHSPRVPAMDPLQPLPGPHTLRLNQRKKESHDLNGVRDPLLPGSHKIEHHGQRTEAE